MAYLPDASFFRRRLLVLFALALLSCGSPPPAAPPTPVAADQQGLLVWWGACADAEAISPKSDGRACLDISFEDRMGPWAYLTKAQVRLDGVTVAVWGDRPPMPPSFVPVFAGRILPGPHRLDVQLSYKTRAYGAYAMNAFTLKVDSFHTWEQRSGQPTDLVVAAYEKGNATTALQERPALAFVSAGDLASQLLRGEGPAAQPLSPAPGAVTEPQAGPWMEEARDRIDTTSFRLRVLERGVRRRSATLVSCVSGRVSEVETLRGQFHGGAWRELTEASTLASRIIEVEQQARACR